MRRFIVLLLLTACATPCVRMPNPNERLLPPKSVIVRHPFDDESFDGHEIEAPRRDEMASNPAMRRAALRELAAMRGPSNPPPPPPPAPDPGPPGPPSETACAWSFVGPTNIHGRVLDIAIDPTNHERLFLATVGGVWRSTDFARRWERVSDDIFAGVFSAVAINSSNPSEVFAGGGDANMISQPTPNGVGIWRSTIGGDAGTWTKTSPPEIDDSLIYRLRVDTKPPNDVYAATSVGVWRGVHAGSAISWSRLDNFDAWTTDVVLDSTGPVTIVYAAVQEPSATKTRGVWKWNGGQWNVKNKVIDTSNSNVIRLAIAKSDPKILYARVEGLQAKLDGIYKTIDAAENWEKQDGAELEVGAGTPNGATCSAGYMASMEVDPTDADVVYAGCLDIFRSTNGGAHFDNVMAGADASYPYYAHVDHHAIAFDPDNPKLVYIGHDGGLDRSTDTSLAPWHWTDVSHGLTIWQVYEAAGHAVISTLLAAGAQDTGNAITYGNRAWNHNGNCDGNGIAPDAGNTTTFYISCQAGTVHVQANAVRGTAGFPTYVPTSQDVYTPLAVDRDLPGHVLAASTMYGFCGDPSQLLRSVDGVTYTPIATAPADALFQRIHIARNSSFQRYYVGFESCGLSDQPQIWSTGDGGGTWVKTLAGLPASRVFAIEADPSDGARAFAALGSSVMMTEDGGQTWISIDGSGATALPPSAMRHDVGIDPSDANIIYVATDVGVFQGTLNGVVASWAPFDEGLPAGVDVRALDVDTKRKALRIGTWGYGFFRRDIAPGATCPERALLVRDNVFDRGASPSTPSTGYFDPEHPVLDPAHPPFFKADDSIAGRLYWWSSSDVRIDVPELDPPKNQIASADHVELETCPLLGFNCPSGTLLDSHPRRGRPARAYVQAMNGGTQPVLGARVIALWTDTTTSTPLLPLDFWTKTFPSIGNPCGTIDPNSPWHLIDPVQPCRSIARIEPAMPEVAKFDWSVPSDAPERACFLTIVESEDDPLPASIRGTNQRNLWDLVPKNRHMTVRNLHIVDLPAPPSPAPPSPAPSMFAEVVMVPNPTPDDGIEILIDGDSPDVRILLPREIEDVRGRRAELTYEEQRFAATEKLDGRWVYEISGDAPLRLPVRPGENWRIGLMTRPTEGTRLSVVAIQRGVVLGGSTYIFRRGIPHLTGALH